jgi:hypothetical protein
MGSKPNNNKKKNNMRMYKNFSCEDFLNSLFIRKQGKVTSKLSTSVYKTMLSLIRTMTFSGLSGLIIVNTLANAAVLTAEMTPEVTAEFKKQLALQTWPAMHTKLALMDNPYAKFYKVIKKKLKKEAEEGHRRRLMTPEESMLTAKKKRFDYCQASVNFFIEFSERSHTLSTVEHKPLTKDQLMVGHGIAYPFTEEQTNSADFRPVQIALELGWKYRGKGKQYAEEFLASCLAVPVSLYYKEDKF